MSTPEQQLATQLANIEKRTGKSLADLTTLVRTCGLTKHGQIVAHLKETLGMGHGDANTLVHVALKSDGASQAAAAEAAGADPLEAIYNGNKASLRGLHEQLMSAIQALGPFEIAPKKTYLSLRRKKQFAMLGPATQSQLELGLNSKSLAGDERLKAQPAGGMCTHKLRISHADEVDPQLLAWVRQAYDEAG
jgi:hypothetical protein